MRFTIILLFCILFVLLNISKITNSQTYFSDNFDKPEESEKKWVDIYGQWEFNDKEYHQLMNAVNCMSLVSDEYWNEDWADYTFEVKANKIDGAEGFLIMFRCMGLMQPRDVALREHPARMQKQQALQYWWNLGGWANTRSQVETWGGGVAGANTNHTIKANEWYDIKIVSTPNDYTLYLNGEKVATVKDSTQGGKGRIGLATWSTRARFDDVLVYGPQGPKLSIDISGKTTTKWAKIKSRNLK